MSPDEEEKAKALQQEHSLREDQMQLRRPGKQTFSHSRGAPPLGT